MDERSTKEQEKAMKDWYTEKRIPASVPRSGLEYEYLYVNGELDIDRIILKKRREHIGTYKVQDLVFLAPLDPKGLRKYRKDRYTRIRDCSGGRKNIRYGMLISQNDGNELIIFEPNQEMLLDMQRRSPEKVRFV